MSEIVVDESGIRQYWDETGEYIDVLVVADMPIGELVRIVDDEVRFVNQAIDFDTIGLAFPPGPTPQGAAVYMPICDDVDDAVTTFRLIAARLEERGISGSILTRELEFTRIGHVGWKMMGFTAGLVTAADPSSPDDLLPDPGAAEAIKNYALEWCTVPEGQTWIKAERTSARIPWERRREFLEAAAINRQSGWALISENGETHSRSVRFEDNGHVLFQIGGMPGPAWDECITDLRKVLTDLSDSLDYACIVKAHLVGSWQELPWFLWEPYREHFEFNQHSMNRQLESTHAAAAYGMQLLGPGHRVPSLPDRWQSHQLDQGHTLIEATDLAAWYAEQPQARLVAQARDDFGDIVVDNVRRI